MYAHEPSNVTTTTARDEFVDPAGIGDFRFLNQRGVFGGTYFVYGMAGPPQGHVVYDPAHHIAFFDQGCCSTHHIELVSGVVAPPKVVARRSLLGVRTKLGPTCIAG